MTPRFNKGDIVQAMSSHYLDELPTAPSTLSTNVFNEKEIGVVLEVAATKVQVACPEGIGWSYKSVLTLVT